jgi:dienelactone hydrolase
VRRSGRLLLPIGAIALLLAPIARAVDATDPVVGSSRCSDASWVGGTTEWCRGQLVYRDYVYDDNGADTRPGSIHGPMLSRATGDIDAREHGQHLNSADIVTLRLWAAGDRLRVRVELNTLYPDDRTVAVLAFDTDKDDATGSEQIEPFGVTAPGIDRVDVLDQRNADPDDPHLGGVIEGDLPLPDAPAGQWDLYAFTALGDGTVMNVAFRPRERGSWWEAEQSSALAAGTVAPFRAEVTRADLLRGDVERPRHLQRGLLERVYRSEYAIGIDQEGVDYDEAVTGRNDAVGPFGQSYAYLGHFQPYSVYVPAGVNRRSGRFGVQLALHGLNAAHASLVANVGMQTVLGDELNRLVVVPLGRGPAGHYSDWSERDVLDVLADVQATYPVDRERVFAGGYSMGGYGAYRFAALYPDIFAGLIDWVGGTGDCLNGTPFGPNERCPSGAVGNVIEYLDNVRHVPAAMLYAAGDELVWPHTANAVRQRFADLGYRHVFWLHTAEHLTFAVLDDWRKEAAWTEDLTLVHDPARVTYRTNAWLDSAALGIVHDRAYWVSGIRAAESGDAVVDLVSHACASSERTTTLTNRAGIDPVPWVSQEAVGTGPVAVTSGSFVEGTLSNVSRITLDTSSPCVTGNVSRIVTDTPVTITFTDGRQPVTITPS